MCGVTTCPPIWTCRIETCESLRYSILVCYTMCFRIWCKKFSDSVGGHFIKSTYKYESCYFAIHTYKERMTFWFSPVMIKIGIAKKPILVYILWVKLTVVMLA